MRCEPMISMASRAVCSGLSMGSCGMLTGTSLPLDSTCGGLPGERIRSLTPGAALSMAAIMSCMATGNGGGPDFAGAGAAAGADISGSLLCFGMPNFAGYKAASADCDRLQDCAAKLRVIETELARDHMTPVIGATTGTRLIKSEFEN